jgi:serine/threonine protein phosphatase PrpC
MASSSEIKIAVYGKTDVGLIREHNEDNLLIADITAGTKSSSPDAVQNLTLGNRGALFLVCDGMGGAAAGEVASTMAVDSISSFMNSDKELSREGFARRLRRAIEDANEKIHIQSRDNQSERGMGTTCTAAGLVDRTLILGQIGDSRCYVFRRGYLAQVTKDQSLAAQLIEAGALTPEEAKGFEHANIILQALGVQERVEVILSHVELRRGDTILLSSDGLHGPVSDEEIRQILVEEKNLKTACERLVARANEHEGPDNITVILARFEGEGLAEPTGEEPPKFSFYDPGADPNDPDPERYLADKVTAEVTVPSRLRLEELEAAATRSTPLLGASGLPPESTTSGETRPLLVFVLLTMVAALAGALFLLFQRAPIPERTPSPAAASNANARTASLAEQAAGDAGPPR